MAAREEREVEIIVRRVGPGRPSRMRIPSPVQVCELRRLVAAEGHLPVEQLKLILRGQTLRDRGVGEDDLAVSLKDGDSLIVAVIPKAPAKHLHENFEDDDDELKFQIPESASWRKKKLLSFLHQKLRLPDIMLIAIFSISLKGWVGVVLWFILAPIAHRWDLGPIYILGTGFAMILINLGKRQDGDVRFLDMCGAPRKWKIGQLHALFMPWGFSLTVVSLTALVRRLELGNSSGAVRETTNPET